MNKNLEVKLNQYGLIEKLMEYGVLDKYEDAWQSLKEELKEKERSLSDEEDNLSLDLAKTIIEIALGENDASEDELNTMSEQLKNITNERERIAILCEAME